MTTLLTVLARVGYEFAIPVSYEVGGNPLICF